MDRALRDSGLLWRLRYKTHCDSTAIACHVNHQSPRSIASGRWEPPEPTDSSHQRYPKANSNHRERPRGRFQGNVELVVSDKDSTRVPIHYASKFNAWRSHRQSFMHQRILAIGPVESRTSKKMWAHLLALWRLPPSGKNLSARERVHALGQAFTKVLKVTYEYRRSARGYGILRGQLFDLRLPLGDTTDQIQHVLLDAREMVTESASFENMVVAHFNRSICPRSTPTFVVVDQYGLRAYEADLRTTRRLVYQQRFEPLRAFFPQLPSVERVEHSQKLLSHTKWLFLTLMDETERATRPRAYVHRFWLYGKLRKQFSIARNRCTTLLNFGRGMDLPPEAARAMASFAQYSYDWALDYMKALNTFERISLVRYEHMNEHELKRRMDLVNRLRRKRRIKRLLDIDEYLGSEAEGKAPSSPLKPGSLDDDNGDFEELDGHGSDPESGRRSG